MAAPETPGIGTPIPEECGCKAGAIAAFTAFVGCVAWFAFLSEHEGFLLREWLTTAVLMVGAGSSAKVSAILLARRRVRRQSRAVAQ